MEADFEKKIRQLISKYALLELLAEFENSAEGAQYMRRLREEAERLSFTAPLPLAQQLVADAIEKATAGKTADNILEILRNPPCFSCSFWNKAEKKCKCDDYCCPVIKRLQGGGER